MEQLTGYGGRCDGCARGLPAAQGRGSWRCDALLAVTRPEDPGCGEGCGEGCGGADIFAARGAVVIRGCGGDGRCGEGSSLAGDGPS